MIGLGLDNLFFLFMYFGLPTLVIWAVIWLLRTIAAIRVNQLVSLSLQRDILRQLELNESRQVR